MIDLKNPRQKAQAALEYMLLLTVVAVVVFIALRPSGTSPSVLNRAQEASEGYYNAVTEVIMGKNPQPINGGWCRAKPNGECECACPAPAFGGAYCVSGGGCTAAAVTGPRGFCGDQFCDGTTETGQAGNPGGKITCWEDCAYVPDCTQCGNPSQAGGCGAKNCLPKTSTTEVPGSLDCGPTQVCMIDSCPPACEGLGYIPPACITPLPPTTCGTAVPPTGPCTINGTCDTGENVANCPGDCKCGNGPPPDPGEECDDGNNVNGDGCSADCKNQIILPAECIGCLGQDWDTPCPATDCPGCTTQCVMVKDSICPKNCPNKYMCAPDPSLPPDSPETACGAIAPPSPATCSIGPVPANNGCSVDATTTGTVGPPPTTSTFNCTGTNCSGTVSATCIASGWEVTSGSSCTFTPPVCTCDSRSGWSNDTTVFGACGGPCGSGGLVCNSYQQCTLFACSPQGCSAPKPDCWPRPACGCGDGTCQDPVNEPQLCWMGDNDCCGDGICGSGESSICSLDCCSSSTACDFQHPKTGNYCFDVNGSYQWMSLSRRDSYCKGPSDCSNTYYWCAAGETMYCRRLEFGIYGWTEDKILPCP